jgi:hypothetical protein
MGTVISPNAIAAGTFGSAHIANVNSVQINIVVRRALSPNARRPLEAMQSLTRA